MENATRLASEVADCKGDRRISPQKALF